MTLNEVIIRDIQKNTRKSLRNATYNLTSQRKQAINRIKYIERLSKKAGVSPQSIDEYKMLKDREKKISALRSEINDQISRIKESKKTIPKPLNIKKFENFKRRTESEEKTRSVLFITEIITKTKNNNILDIFQKAYSEKYKSTNLNIYSNSEIDEIDRILKKYGRISFTDTLLNFISEQYRNFNSGTAHGILLDAQSYIDEIISQIESEEKEKILNKEIDTNDIDFLKKLMNRQVV